MKREEQVNEVINQYYAEKYAESKEKIKAYYWKNRDRIHGEFAGAIDRGARRCREQGKKVTHIIISILLSSRLTKTYELQIAFCDERLYLDDAPVYEYWAPEFIFRYIEEDLQFFQKMAAKTIPRIREYELYSIRNTYIWNHYFLVMLLLKELVPGPVEAAWENSGVLDDKVMVLLGRYMERGIAIYQRGQTDEIFSS